MAIEGLPFHRQEPDSNQDILAGADFLSVFMESSLRRAYAETTSTVPPTTILVELEEETDYTTKRDKRNSNTIDFNSENSHTPYSNNLYTNTIPLSQSTEQFSVSDSSTNKDGVVVAVRVSSSVGRSINTVYRRPIGSPGQKYFTSKPHSTNIVADNNINRIFKVPATEQPLESYFSSEQDLNAVTKSKITTVNNDYIETTTGKPVQNYFGSEQHPSIVAEASKSELSVEESEPITKDSEIASDFSRSFASRVRVVPAFDQNPEYLNQNVQSGNKQPYNPTVIYHDNPGDTNSARSVSYSSIIQTLPHIPIDGEKSEPHERHERNYNDAKSPYVNTFETNEAKRKQNDSRTLNWQKAEPVERTTEKPWENPQRYTPTTPLPVELPKVYGQPEQNYEVDEELSVVTNGRAHGVQPTKPEKKLDDNQKFGYVVEGKNYRKYRVEERTADGFIVGEYGVVSHDDGSLRGVRYTADGTINPRLISEALMKFLSL